MTFEQLYNFNPFMLSGLFNHNTLESGSFLIESVSG